MLFKGLLALACCSVRVSWNCCIYKDILMMGSQCVHKAIKLIFYFGLFGAINLLTGCIDMASNDARNTQIAYKHTMYPEGEVFTMRGGLGGVFSKGMNRLQNTLEDVYHVNSYSTTWYKSHALSNYIIHQYKTEKLRGPIILVGHSLGANDQIKVARYLARANIPVALLMTVDATSPLTVPPNVEHVVNIYYPAHIPLFTGQVVTVMDPTRTRLDNFNVTTRTTIDVNHFNIESNSVIQKLMIDNILGTLNKAKKNNR
jgi:hypothetical protein